MTAIPAPIQTLIEVFTTSLADVRFADVDAQTLAGSAAEVEAAANSVAAAHSALDAAREALQSKQDALHQRAQRALAYGRIYAEGDEALTRKLDAVSLPRGPHRAKAEDALQVSADPQPAPRPRARSKRVRTKGARTKKASVAALVPEVPVAPAPSTPV